MFETIGVERDAAVAVVTLNRPHVLNALNRTMLDELDRAMSELASDAAIRAVIVTGAGEKAFVAGADIKELAAKTPIATRYIIEAVNRGIEMPFAEASALEATLFGLTTATDDMREGTTAFLEKRKPVFKGH